MQKFYLENSFETIKNAENKYDVMPLPLSEGISSNSLNRLCYNRTRAIAQAHQKKLATNFLEEELNTYRNYALKHSTKE